MKRSALLSAAFCLASGCTQRPAFAQNTVTVVVNGTTYTGSLTALKPPVVTPTGAPQLPKIFMTSAWPLNQPANTLPLETRSLNSGNPFTPKPIADQFKTDFGPNHLQFNTTMRITAVNSVATPTMFAPVTITQNWGSDDATHVPVIGCKIEGATAADPTGGSGGDRHCLIYDAATGLLHELFGVSATGNVYSAAAYRMWDVTKLQVGKPGQNSADAAGLPIMPLLLRYAEAATGSINHALRFTIQMTRLNNNGGAFTPPASHASGGNWGSMAYMGQRFYLRQDFPTTGLAPVAVTIVNCLKTYGLVLADNGITGLVVADNDSRWDQTMLGNLGASLTLNDFVIVNSGPIIDSSGAAAQ
jgi:hypothetical protein